MVLAFDNEFRDGSRFDAIQEKFRQCLSERARGPDQIKHIRESSQRHQTSTAPTSEVSATHGTRPRHCYATPRHASESRLF
jgi:hypothetical protein